MKFKEKLYRFMYGRYGADDLYSFLMICFVVTWVAEIITMMIIPNSYAVLKTVLSIVFGVLLVSLATLTTWRAMSRNIAKRRHENEIYLRAMRTTKRFFSFNTSRKTKSLNRDDYSHIFRDCTKCGSVLRLPRREGRHKVKCPRCAHSFYVTARKFKIKTK